MKETKISIDIDCYGPNCTRSARNLRATRQGDYRTVAGSPRAAALNKAILEAKPGRCWKTELISNWFLDSETTPGIPTSPIQGVSLIAPFDVCDERRE
jgi:hypothetical protein